jgi:hypothetical protein
MKGKLKGPVKENPFEELSKKVRLGSKYKHAGENLGLGQVNKRDPKIKFGNSRAKRADF